MKGTFRQPNRLARKFIAGVTLILLLTLVGTLFANSRMAEKVYLYEQREYVRKISRQLEQELEEGSTPQQAIQTIEEQEKVLIVFSADAEDPGAIAGALRESFKEKGLGFQQFWLWEQDYRTAVQNGSQFRLYSQDRLNYNILVQYLSLESGLYAVAAIVPDAEGVIRIVNRMGFVLNSAAILVAIGLIFVLTRHITKPLEKVCAFTREVSVHRYPPLVIHTGDELEEVADSLNEMACAIQQYQKQLEEKNEQMKQLLSDVAHDLKTPLSLVGMYAAGMQDGLDDGTFLDTIVRQNQKMSEMVERLLHLSRIEGREHPCEWLMPDQLLTQCMEEQNVLFAQRNLTWKQEIQPGLALYGSRELVGELFSNLLTNAAKYAAGGTVEVTLRQQGNAVQFRITNAVGPADLDLDRIWQPFYVGENSRNKALSGTGLGLPIVQKIADRFGYAVSCERNGDRISFQVLFPANQPQGAGASPG